MSRDDSRGRTDRTHWAERISVMAMFLFMLLSLALVVSLVWFLASGKYLSALLSLLGALALSSAAGRLVLLTIATRKP